MVYTLTRSGDDTSRCMATDVIRRAGQGVASDGSLCPGKCSKFPSSEGIFLRRDIIYHFISIK